MLAATIVPHFLDRRYYDGPKSGHYNGTRFFNPDGDEDTAAPPTGGGRAGFLWGQLTGDDGRPPWPDHVPIRAATPGELLPTYPPSLVGWIAAAPDRMARTPMRATWVGHASVLVQTPGFNILTIPSGASAPARSGSARAASPRRASRSTICRRSI